MRTEGMVHVKTGKYRHFKGKDYEVFGLATHSETGEKLVVYRTLYGNFDLWVRPETMFCGTVWVDGIEVERFRYIGDE